MAAPCFFSPAGAYPLDRCLYLLNEERRGSL